MRLDVHLGSNMMMPPSINPKIYHIVHVNRLASIIKSGELLCDATVNKNADTPGTTIGMDRIKERRLTKCLTSHTGLCVGDCVPFYFCPRSVMLFVIHKGTDPDLKYQGGQDPIVHLVADLRKSVCWADEKNRRWAFTLSNAGSMYFEDHKDLQHLDKLNWDAIGANRWSGQGVSRLVKEGKQAEFLLESTFPWALVEKIGVRSQAIALKVNDAMKSASHRPVVEITQQWYY